MTKKTEPTPTTDYQYDAFEEAFPDGYLFSKRVNEIREEARNMLGVQTRKDALKKMTDALNETLEAIDTDTYPEKWEKFSNLPEATAYLILNDIKTIVQLLKYPDSVRYLMTGLIDQKDKIQYQKYSESMAVLEDQFSFAARMELVGMLLMNLENKLMPRLFDRKDFFALASLGRKREKIENHNEALSSSAKEIWQPLVEEAKQLLADKKFKSKASAIEHVARKYGVNPGTLRARYYEKKY